MNPVLIKFITVQVTEYKEQILQLKKKQKNPKQKCDYSSPFIVCI